MAALTKKRAGALARSGSSGGISMFSDNVGQVAALSCGAPIHNFSRGLIGSTTAHMRLVNCSTSSHCCKQQAGINTLEVSIVLVGTQRPKKSQLSG